MKGSVILIQFLVAALLFGACATPAPQGVAGPDVSRTSARAPENERVILWWSDYAGEVSNITHVVNTVWVGSIKDNPDKDPATNQDTWLARGVIPLDWAGGRVYADRGPDGLATKWSGSLEKGFVGIAIDEFGAPDDAVDRTLAEGLLELRRRFPDAIIAVWHAGLISEVEADAYREAADLVLLEVYLNGASFLGSRYGFRLNNVRSHGLEAKTVVAIGVGDEQFADTAHEIDSQVTWLLENATDFRGIGFYAPNATREQILLADSVLSEFNGRVETRER